MRETSSPINTHLGCFLDFMIIGTKILPSFENDDVCTEFQVSRNEMNFCNNCIIRCLELLRFEEILWYLTQEQLLVKSCAILFI